VSSLIWKLISDGGCSGGFLLEERKFLRQLAAIRESRPHFDEGADNKDAHFDSSRAVKNVGRYDRTMLGKCVGEVFNVLSALQGRNLRPRTLADVRLFESLALSELRISWFDFGSDKFAVRLSDAKIIKSDSGRRGLTSALARLALDNASDRCSRGGGPQKLRVGFDRSGRFARR